MAVVKFNCCSCRVELDAFAYQTVVICRHCGAANHALSTQPPCVSTQHQSPVIPTWHVHLQRAIKPFAAITVASMIGVTALAFIIEKLELEGRIGDQRWLSNELLIIDIDGDQADDIIGFARKGLDDHELVAVTADGWDPLWSVDLGEIEQDSLVWLEPNNRVVLVSQGPTLIGYDVENGARRWDVKLSDVIEDVGFGQGRLWVTTKDERVVGVGVLDGARTSESPGPDVEERTLGPRTPWKNALLMKFEGLRVDFSNCPSTTREAIEEPCAQTHGVALAHRVPGTAIPFLVGFDPETQVERWRAQLTTSESLETLKVANDLKIEFMADDAIIAFVTHQGAARVRRISLVDGTTRWQTELPVARFPSLGDLTVGKDRVFVIRDQAVHVLDLGDGTLLAVLGGTPNMSSF